MFSQLTFSNPFPDYISTFPPRQGYASALTRGAEILRDWENPAVSRYRSWGWSATGGYGHTLGSPRPPFYAKQLSVALLRFPPPQVVLVGLRYNVSVLLLPAAASRVCILTSRAKTLLLLHIFVVRS